MIELEGKVLVHSRNIFKAGVSCCPSFHTPILKASTRWAGALKQRGRGSNCVRHLRRLGFPCNSQVQCTLAGKLRMNNIKAGMGTLRVPVTSMLTL